MPKLSSQAQRVLQVFNQLRARPGDRLHHVTLVRNGIGEEDVAPGVRECARLGHVIEHPDAAELTAAGWKAIGWDERRGRPRRCPAAAAG